MGSRLQVLGGWFDHFELVRRTAAKLSLPFRVSFPLPFLVGSTAFPCVDTAFPSVPNSGTCSETPPTSARCLPSAGTAATSRWLSAARSRSRWSQVRHCPCRVYPLRSWLRHWLFRVSVCFRCVRGCKALYLSYVSAVLVAKTLPLPCVSAASAAKTPPLPCGRPSGAYHNLGRGPGRHQRPPQPPRPAEPIGGGSRGRWRSRGCRECRGGQPAGVS